MEDIETQVRAQQNYRVILRNSTAFPFRVIFMRSVPLNDKIFGRWELCACTEPNQCRNQRRNSYDFEWIISGVWSRLLHFDLFMYCRSRCCFSSECAAVLLPLLLLRL